PKGTRLSRFGSGPAPPRLRTSTWLGPSRSDSALYPSDCRTALGSPLRGGSNMRRTMLAFSALALAVGCNPLDFRSTLDRAPVQYIGAPDNFGSNVGRTLLSLAPPADKPKVAARLLFASTDMQALAVADFDGDGNPQVQTAECDDLSTLGLSPGQGGISSAAWLSGPGAAGTVVLGMPDVYGTQGQGTPNGRVGFLNLVADASGKVDFESAHIWQDGAITGGAFFTQPQGHFGLAVARGQVTQTASD